MKNSGFSAERFAKVPIVGIIRGLTFDEISEIIPVYISSGLTTLEITMNTDGAEQIIRYASENFAGTLNIGAGTVCNMTDLDKALSAGAQFIVTPVINPEVIKACVAQRIPVFPGAFTPTEIYNAWESGATMVKVYPATSLGSSYIRDVKAPLNKIKLLPTGGVNKGNIREFMNAGADGVGIGSQLFDKNFIKAKDWAGLENHFREFTSHFI